MEDFSYMTVVWAVLPAIIALLGGLYISWKAKVAGDGVQDWKDEVVKGVDLLVQGLNENDKEPKG